MLSYTYFHCGRSNQEQKDSPHPIFCCYAKIWKINTVISDTTIFCIIIIGERERESIICQFVSSPPIFENLELNLLLQPPTFKCILKESL